MDCKHKRLRAVGDDLFCKDCGAQLPLLFLTAGSAGKAAAEETPAEIPAEKKPARAPAKKKTAKKTE